MPRLLINGFPPSNRACFHIRINAGAKGAGSQLKMLFDRTIAPLDGIYELPLDKIYLGAKIRLEVSVPGYLIIDKNVSLKTNIGYTSLLLTKQNEPDQQLLKDCYGSVAKWQAVQCKSLNRESKEQFASILADEQKQQRYTFLGVMLLIMIIAGILYLLTGAVGIFIVLVFAFYYHEKNKLNSWSDISK